MKVTSEDMRELGEFGLIDRIAAKIVPGRGVALGIGDDAAAVEQANGVLTLSTSDMLVEGVHFDLSLCDPGTLGRKSLAVNLSDIAATCASPAGMVISITLLGEQVPEKIVRRNGACTHDLIFVTGTIGDSALGLQLLRQGHTLGPAVARHLDPSPRVREGQALAVAGLATSMIDVSDGLLGDLQHLLDNSSVGALVYLDKIPVSHQYRQYFRQECGEFYSVALTGGEDYELLFTAPPCQRHDIISLFAKLGTPLAEIGEVTSERRVCVISPEGTVLPVEKKGYDHFL
ncbi:MAG: thiL [Geobacteraceae bacterium]|nr:thiL [Geobacteraceae bacterium]